MLQSFIFRMLFSAFFFGTVAAAQIIIEEDEDTQTDQSTSSFRLLDHLSGGFSVSNSDGSVERQLLLGGLSFNYNFLDDKVSLDLSISVTSSELTFHQELSDNAKNLIAQGLKAPLPEERSLTIDLEGEPKFEYSVSYRPTSWLSTETGFFTPGLGQLGFISPVALLLPLTTDNNGFSFNKNDIFEPQNNYNIQYFPLPNLELSYYKAVGDISLSPITYTYISEDLSHSGNIVTEEQAQELLEATPNEYIRLVWQPSWGAIGLTLFDGVYSFGHITDDRIECMIKADNGTTTLCPTNENDIADDEQLIFLRTNSGVVKLPDRTSIGLEVAVNLGRRTFIFEVTQSSEQRTVSNFVSNDIQSGGISKSLFLVDPAFASERANYFNWYETGGDLNLDVEETFWSVGYESRSADGTGTLILQLLGIDYNFDTSHFPRTWEEISTGENRDMFLESAIIPSFLYTKDYSLLSRRSTLATGLGFFASFAGVFVSNSVAINDNFSFLIGLTVVQNVADSQAAEASDDDDYRFSSDLEPGMSFGLNVNF